MIKSKFSKLLLLAGISAISFAYAADNTTAAPSPIAPASVSTPVSTDYTVAPIQVEFNRPGKIETLKIYNMGTDPLYAQANLLNYVQHYNLGKLVESNTLITEKSAIVVTPIVFQKIPGKSQQIIRLMAVKQDENKEMAYRLIVKSLTPTSLTTSATTFSIGYSIPVFVLPKTIHEAYTVSYVKEGKKSYLKITNTGNVHISFKDITTLVNGTKQTIPGVTRELPGYYQLVEVPANVAKTFKSGSVVNLTITKAKLMQFDQNTSESATVTVS